MTDYLAWLARRGREFEGYPDLWRWSVTEIEPFWESLAGYFGVGFHAPPARILDARRMPGARWFEGARLNYAEEVLRPETEGPALISRREGDERVELSRDELRRRVAAARGGLARLGVGPGDRVAAFASNTPEAVVGLLATASLGATWSSCPPEFGVEAVLDRFRQIEPKVLLGVDGYRYGGRDYDRRDALARIAAELPTLERTVVLPWVAEEPSLPGALSWAELGSRPGELLFEPVPFDHPLWILYSSGTTGLPKAIVHGHGGIVLEHLKQIGLHTDLGPGDRFFWFSTTGWMMWNYLVGGLLVGATAVLYDGSPGHPDLSALWRMAAQEGVTYFGASAPFLMACRRAGLAPGRDLDLGGLRGVGSTGAPLPAEGFVWVSEAVGEEVWVGSLSGGTDLCTGFVGPCPLLPVRAGEIQCASLGARVEAYDATGRPVVDEVGELVLTEPMPSMPLFFWGDPCGERYRESYFDTFPGVWRHGDWIEMRRHGGAVIYGRSDSTLNRGGVRMGTSEFYRVLHELDGVGDSVVVDTGGLGEEGKLWLFVVPAAGATLDDRLVAEIRRTLRASLSPRHVPDEIRAIPEVPVTLSGKKLEVPVKKILNGVPAQEAVNPGTLKNPDALAALLAAAGATAG